MGSFGGSLESVKNLPREAKVEIACVNGTASEAAAIEVSAPFEPGPGFTLGGEVPYQYGCLGFGRGARRFRWDLEEESKSREFALGDHREHRECPPDVSFPMWVFGRIGSNSPHVQQSTRIRI